MRPRLGVGTVVPHHRVVAPVGSEAVVVDGAVVLVAGGIADVEEPGAVRFPGHRTRPRVRDAIAVAARRRPVGAGDEVEHGVLGPALADADGDERSVVRREVPVDRRRRVGARRRRIEQHDGRRRRIGGRRGGRARTARRRQDARSRTGWSPRSAACWRTGSSINATRRWCHAARAGTSSADRVRAFWAATQATTSGSSPSSSQR